MEEKPLDTIEVIPDEEKGAQKENGDEEMQEADQEKKDSKKAYAVQDVEKIADDWCAAFLASSLNLLSICVKVSATQSVIKLT